MTKSYAKAVKNMARFIEAQAFKMSRLAPEKTYYQANIEGFNSGVVTVMELQTWWDALKVQYDFSGKVLKIYRGYSRNDRNDRFSGWVRFDSTAPIKELTV